MKEYICDVVVVGAGPAGSMAAKHAAENGLDVILIEKRAEIGTPLRCAEGVSKRRLREVGIEPDMRWISSVINGTVMRTHGGSRLKVDEAKDDGEVGYVLDRKLFDKELAARAAESGARVMVRTGCTGIIRNGEGRISGIEVRTMDGIATIKCSCVVAADGFESQVARWAGVDTSLGLNDIDSCFQYVMSGVDIDQGYCEFLIGSDAPGGYIWIFPKGGDRANVGIGVLASKSEDGARAKDCLDRYIASDPRLNKGCVLEMVSGMVSLSPGLKRTVYDNLIIVGDAARVIDPMTGGGLYHAMLTGMEAGKVLAEKGSKNNYTADSMISFEDGWRKKIGPELDRNWRIKEKFVDIDDATLDGFIDTASKVGMKKVRMDDLVVVANEHYPKMILER